MTFPNTDRDMSAGKEDGPEGSRPPGYDRIHSLLKTASTYKSRHSISHTLLLYIVVVIQQT